MIQVGQKVLFKPLQYDPSGDERIRAIQTIGTVVEVYPEHNWFSVKYGKSGLRTSFHFCEIGENVQLVQ